MIYPSIDEITKGKYNRYTLCIATAKCARLVTDEYVEQRELAEKMLANKETDKSLASMIKREIRDEKAVKTAIKRLYNGDYVICEGKEELTLLKGLVERAVRTPSKSILFNIGRQADAMGRADRKDAILPAFLQVFNAQCCYCEQNPAVAQFERELDEEAGHLAAFEAKFNELTGKDWFMTFPDFDDYVKTRERAYTDYEQRLCWAKKGLVNIAMSGYFSSDRTIKEYNRDIWKL